MASTYERETLRDGSVRFRTETCTAVFTRLRPSVALVRIGGSDGGAFTEALFAELLAEVVRFGRPLELLLDLRDAASPASSVSDAWTRWFEARRRDLAQVDILVRSKLVGLTVAIARHFSGSGDRIRIHEDVAAFTQAMARAAPDLPPLPADPPAVRIERATLGDGSLRLACGGCTFTYASVRRGVIHLRVEGEDAGQLGALPMDELLAAIDRDDRPAEVFVDASGGNGSAVVVEAWTTWFRAHAGRLRAVHVHVPSRVLGLSVAIARQLSRTTHLVRLYEDHARFEAAVARAAG